MVSTDPPESNRAFAESAGGSIEILSDPDGEAARAFGVLTPGGRYARRWSYFIGRDGRIRHIDKKVRPAQHGEDLVEMLGSSIRTSEGERESASGSPERAP